MEPMSPERLAEIRAADEKDYADGRILKRRPRSAIAQRRELLAEVDRLAGALAELEDLGTEAYAEKIWQEAQLRNLEIRGGHFELDITQVEHLASAYVAFARTLLGDASNYSETTVEYRAKIAEEPEAYLLTVQRTGPGRLTPHEARQRAEAERNELRTRVAALQAELGNYPPGTWDVEDERYEVLLGETVYDDCSAPGPVAHIIDRLRTEIAADELEDGPIYVRRTMTYIRTAGSEA